ncbi:hypothetical protein BDD12DRAFT_396145 [Trichophaea hybrida]|nr:hypothetical protein BDD12DRAFT_396145 [Trichophaea hybrida]
MHRRVGSGRIPLTHFSLVWYFFSFGLFNFSYHPSGAFATVVTGGVWLELFWFLVSDRSWVSFQRGMRDINTTKIGSEIFVCVWRWVGGLRVCSVV